MNRRDIIKLGALVPMAIIGNTRRTGQSVSAQSPAVNSFPEFQQSATGPFGLTEKALESYFQGSIRGPFNELLKYDIQYRPNIDSWVLTQTVDNLPEPWKGMITKDYLYISSAEMEKAATNERRLNMFALEKMVFMYDDYIAWVDEKQPYADDTEWSEIYAKYAKQPSRSVT